jgi:hypothetical protein
MKSDQVTVQQRVEEILELRLLGAEFVNIRQHAAQRGWNVSDRQLWRYIAAGDDVLARTLEKDREKLLNRHIAQRRALLGRAIAGSDYGTALRIMQDDAKLSNLYPPSADAQVLAKAEEMQKRLAALEAEKRGDHGDRGIAGDVPGAGESHHRAGEGGAEPVGARPGRPDPANEGGGTPARPVAGETLADDAGQDLAPLFPPGGQEPGGGGLGNQGRDP